MNKINGMTLDSNYILTSFDIISMYTNISIKLVIKSIEKRWVSKNTISKKEFMNATSHS